MSGIINVFIDLIERYGPVATRTLQYGTLFMNGYEVVEKCREIANQNGPATLRQKVGVVFGLTNLTTSAVSIVYYPESVIRESSQENQTSNYTVRDIYESHLPSTSFSSNPAEERDMLYEILADKSAGPFN